MALRVTYSYLDATPRKLAVMGAILLSFAVVITATFLFKESKFGSLHIWQAVGRTIEKNILFGWYSLRYAGMKVSSAAVLNATNDDEEVGDTAFAIPVLVYHSLPKDKESDHVTRATFMDQMFALKKAGWNTVSLADLELYLRGEKELPRRSFLITFDDGARDSYYPSDPVFKLLGYRAVSFILPKYSAGEGTYYYLSSGEVRSMLKSGRWEVQSHGLNSHEFPVIDADGTTGPALANLLWLPEENRQETIEEYRERVFNDLTTSRSALEAEFGHPITAFAFPFGEFGQLSINNPESMDIVEDAAKKIYDLSFYQTWRGEGFSYNYPRPGLQMVKRIRVEPQWSGDELVQRLEIGLPKAYALNETFDKDKGWFSIWGGYEIENGELRMKTLPDQSGSAVLLDGTGHYGDYQFTAVVEVPSRTGVSLHARYADHENNAACNFGNGFVHAEDTFHGERRVINGVRNDAIVIPEGAFTISVRVVGRTISCYLNGEKMVETPFLNPGLMHGGIGIKIWDPVLGKAEIRVKEATVEPVIAGDMGVEREGSPHGEAPERGAGASASPALRSLPAEQGTDSSSPQISSSSQQNVWNNTATSADTSSPSHSSSSSEESSSTLRDILDRVPLPLPRLPR